MDKISATQAQQLMKTAAVNIRALSKENAELRTKVASYERKVRAEQIANLMEEKGYQPDTSFQEKVASLLTGDRDLAVVEEAVKMGAPQIKVASVDDDSNGGQVPTDGDIDGKAAEANFVSGLIE
jgi:hypothetical protein